MSRPLTMPFGLSVALIDWPDTRTCRPTRLPDASRPAESLHCEIGRKKSCAWSSSRLQISLTGRAGEFLGDGGRLPGEVLRAAAPAEAAAEVVAVHLALAERNAGHLRQRRERRLEVLRRHPGLGLVVGDPHGAVHGLHAGVRQERRRIDRLDLLRGLRDGLQRIAVLAVAVGLLGGEAFLQHLGDAGVGDVAVAGLVPDDRQRVERRLGVPPGVGDDGDGVVAAPSPPSSRRACPRTFASSKLTTLPPNTGQALIAALSMPGSLTSIA